MTATPPMLGYQNHRYQIANFAGNLVALKSEYAESLGERRRRLARRLDAIVDALVLPNGVRKTTGPERLNGILDQVLADKRCRPAVDTIEVLDVPASTGIASLASFERLRREYRITRYVLGDLTFQVLYDPDRGLVFDEAGNLLQVRGRKRFFSIYRPHVAGRQVSVVTQLLFLPLTLRTWYLRQRHVYSPDDHVIPIQTTHPDIEPLLADGVIQLRRMDVFEEVPGTYDLILCCNLLQRKYFPPDVIARGMEKLGAALRDDGVLVVGSPDVFGHGHYLVARKAGGVLETVTQTGEI